MGGVGLCRNYGVYAIRRQSLIELDGVFMLRSTNNTTRRLTFSACLSLSVGPLLFILASSVTFAGGPAAFVAPSAHLAEEYKPLFEAPQTQRNDLQALPVTQRHLFGQRIQLGDAQNRPNNQIGYESDSIGLLKPTKTMPAPIAPPTPAAPTPIALRTSPPRQEPRQTEGQTPVWWWEREISTPISLGQPALRVDVSSLLELTIRCSQQVKAVGMNRWIQGAQTEIARAEFDPQMYADGRFDDTSDPVGNTLTTGGPPRLQDHRARFEAGLRSRTLQGGSISLSQRLGHDNSNSLFFIPNNQGTARMALEMRQPLLEGRGKTYNQSFIITTVFETEQAEAEYLASLQNRLFEVGTAYWNLYQERVTLLQRQRHVQRAAGIAEELEQRQSFDALRSQVLRAKAAVATRNSELAVAEAELANSQSRIRALINAPCLQGTPMPELIPSQPPPNDEFSIDVAANLSIALRGRPEMRALAAQLQAAEIRTAQASHELLPSLDLVLDSYLSGLEGNSNVSRAWSEQFTEGAPSYGVGLQFSVPLGNRAAQARL